MKNLNYLNEFRVPLYGDLGDEGNGAFFLKIEDNYREEKYTVIASNGDGWDHVSISHKSKVPSWNVMCILKDMFFEEDEVAMQLHPAKKDSKKGTPICLHLWRPQEKEIPLPPREFI